MLTTREAGTTIFNAALVIAKAAKEIEAMMTEMGGQLQEVLEMKNIVRPAGIQFVVDEEGTRERKDENEWLCQAYVSLFRLIKKGKTVLGHLGFQFCLGDEDLRTVGIDEAVVHIMFAKSVWAVDDFGLPPATYMDEWGDGWSVSLESDRLWRFHYKEDDYEESAWAFTVPLAELNTVEDLKNQIVLPVAALLQDTSVDQALATGGKILRFTGDAESCRRKSDE